ncbi:hypothetical protein [Providencia manganoxydans]|uniref:hypothetical protein n=1 Tax=Providencia manganoxydans TaxID=2923283 RepID=UPI0034E3DDB8
MSIQVALTQNNAVLINIEEGLKIIDFALDRMPWSISKALLSDSGFSLSRGVVATKRKIREQVDTLSSSRPQKLNDSFHKLQNHVFQHCLYGEKAFFQLNVDEKDNHKLISIIDDIKTTTDNTLPLSKWIMDDANIQNAKKQAPEIIYVSEDKNTLLILFQSVRNFTLHQDVPIKDLPPEYSDYDSVVAKKNVKRQCFDVCKIDIENNTISLMIDTFGLRIGNNELLAKKRILDLLQTEHAKSKLLYEDVDFFSIIQPLYDQNVAPFINQNYRVFELSFLTNEGTTHKEKKKDLSKDLRDDLFNQVGIQAVGDIGLYRIGVKISKDSLVSITTDDIEMIIPGTLKRYLKSSMSPVNYVIMNKCVSRTDFEALEKLIRM